MKAARYIMLGVLAIVLCAAAAHKFYVAVFRMDYVPSKKRIEVSARIFADDLEAALAKKHNKKFYIGDKRELPGTDAHIAQYLAAGMQVKINGREKELKFLGKEMEDDVLICYLIIPTEGDVKSIAIQNSILFEMFNDQQNIIHANINRNKKSLLLTNDTPGGSLEF